MSLALQGDFPWDEKDFRYIAIAVAGVSSALLYYYFRDTGKEISWKDFIHRYVVRGMVSRDDVFLCWTLKAASPWFQTNVYHTYTFSSAG